MAIRLHKLAVALGVFIVSAPAFSHGHHSHGKPLTEVEQKAANGVFDDTNVQNRTLSDWDGVWQSVYPLLQSGKLDPVFQKKDSPINQARKAFVTYSNVKILKAKPLNIYNLAII